ncbi:MAG: aminotransferase class I/II-fold pyridoxal phosphate-dependent enzyme [Desulfobacterales bacterium]|jgi:dTDP-4-amino-4,6-dideoxygalactose transaminase|nr:aminotransferase class I/II-fold pyridoxal phosphate-dependent enzyme [Desulfobacterales bacterium]
MSSKTKKKITFTKEFNKQEPIPEEGIQRALELLQSGRLHRYNTAAGEISDVALLEKEFAAYIGTTYCAAFSSCGCSIYVALKCAGVQPGDKVLTNAFTLAPVPGAIQNAGADPVFVECTSEYTIDLVDLEQKAKSSSSSYFLLSYMRGHIPDMDVVSDICKNYNLFLIEDCAHTMGGGWDNRNTATFGKIGCFSTQTYKHINSGEGGLLVTDDDNIIARAILYSGSYMLYDTHISKPPPEKFEPYKKITPNLSLRMSNLQAAILRPQLRILDRQVSRWNERYACLEKGLDEIDGITVPSRTQKEHFVGSSIQFTLENLSYDQMARFLDESDRRGVRIKWFGWKEPRGYTSTFESWQYFTAIPDLPQTNHVLDQMCDMRIPLTFTIRDCETIAMIIRDMLEDIAQ